MKLLLPFICLLSFSCNIRQQRKDETQKTISDTSSLYYKGKPLYVFNENIDNLITKSIFYQDTVNREDDGYSYLTRDTFFFARQSTGIIICQLDIKTNNLRQIQRVYGQWIITVQMNDKTKQEAIDTIKQKFFPNIPQDIILSKSDTIRHISYIEEFKSYSSPDSSDIDIGYLPYWRFVYEAKRPKNGL